MERAKKGEGNRLQETWKAQKILTDFGSPYLYSTHGGRASVLSRAFENAKDPRKWSAWFPNRPEI
jgi:hypothetical protein